MMFTSVSRPAVTAQAVLLAEMGKRAGHERLAADPAEARLVGQPVGMTHPRAGAAVGQLPDRSGQTLGQLAGTVQFAVGRRERLRDRQSAVCQRAPLDARLRCAAGRRLAERRHAADEEIDRLVYQLYQLTTEEIEQVQ